MRRKILSLATATVLALSFSVPAFAAEPIDSPSTEKVKITFTPNVQTESIDNFVSNNAIAMDSFTITVDDTYTSGYVINTPDEPVFCVGCSDASALTAGTEYYWIAYGNETGSDGCKAKLNMQRGHRIIDGIYEQTWNIFGDETETVISFSSWDTTESGTATF